MPKTNTVEIYSKLIAAFTLISERFEKDLPQLTEAEFLGVFGAEFQAQLSDAGKEVFKSVLEEKSLDPVQKGLSEAFQKDYQETLKAATGDFIASYDLDESIKIAQSNLQKKLTLTKGLWLRNLAQELNKKGHSFTQEDKAKLEDAFTGYLDKNYAALSHHLKEFKNLPAVYAKYQLHLDHKEAQLKADKRISHTVTGDLALEELTAPLKPDPAVGFKVARKNLSAQMLSDLASAKPGESIDLKVVVPNRQDIVNRIANLGYQARSVSAALAFCIILLFVAVAFRNDEKRVFQAIKKLIDEKGLQIDPTKITLEIVTPTASGSDKVVRKKGALDIAHIKELQSRVDGIRDELQEEHHRSNRQTDQKSVLTASAPLESGYNTETEDDESEEIKNTTPRP